MNRDEIKEFFAASLKVENAFGGLTHREAIPAMKALDDMRDLVGEQLPGGYYGTCIGCEEVKGQDEMMNCGDEDLCKTCADRLASEKPVG